MKYVTNDLIHRVLVDKSANYMNAIPKVLWNDVENAYVEFINNFLHEYNVMPPMEVFSEKFVNFRHTSVSSEVPLKLIFDVISHNLSEKYVNEHIDDPHPNKTKREWIEELLRVSKINDVNVIEYTEFDRNTYQQEIKVIPFGVPWFDKTFEGLFPGEVGFIFGRMKSMKTTLLQFLMLNLLKNGTNILSISQEISNIKFAGKLDAFSTNMNPKLFRKGVFNADEKAKLDKLSDELRSKEKGRLTLGGKVGSLNDLKALFYNAKNRPQVIMIDAVELLAAFDQKRELHHSLSEVAYGLQAMALDLKVPIIGTLQANRSAAKSSEMDTTQVAGSDTFARACEWLLGISTTYEPERTIMEVNTVVFRSGELAKTYIEPNFKTMEFKFLELATASYEVTEASLENRQFIEEALEIREKLVNG